MNIKSTIQAITLFAFFSFTQVVTAQGTSSQKNYNVKDFVKLDALPKWFQKTMAREKKVKKKSSLKIEKFNVNKKVLGKVELLSLIHI